MRICFTMQIPRHMLVLAGVYKGVYVYTVQRGLIEGEQLIMLPFPKRSPSSSFCDVTLSHQTVLQLLPFHKPSPSLFCDLSHDIALPLPKSSPFCDVSMML